MVSGCLMRKNTARYSSYLLLWARGGACGRSLSIPTDLCLAPSDYSFNWILSFIVPPVSPQSYLCDSFARRKTDPNVYDAPAPGCSWNPPGWWSHSFLWLLLTVQANLNPGKNSHKYLRMSPVVMHEHIVNKRAIFCQGHILPPKL